MDIIESSRQIVHTENEINESFFLTVHSGISFGVVGGCDVGMLDRWEYFLLGNPVEEVGACVSKASKGEIVLKIRSLVLLKLIVDSTVLRDSFYSIGEDFHRLSTIAWRNSIHFSDTASSESLYFSLESLVTSLHSSQICPINTFSEVQKNAELHSHNAFRLLGPDLSNHGELRSVVTLFVKIWNFSPFLVTTSNEFCFESSVLGFICKSAVESEHDSKLLSSMQSFVEVVIRGLERNGGQLRQFMLDDKGLVSIGSIGLRGSVTKNPSVSGVQAALDITKAFDAMGIEASVGVTLGRVYCGKVGSASRHEYTILGRSVNLAARLMCNAAVGTILCDGNIRFKSKSLYTFDQLPALQAKGFQKPVPIFKLIARVNCESSEDESQSKQFKPLSLKSQVRRDELESALQFLLCGVSDKVFGCNDSVVNVKRVLVLQGPHKYGKSTLMKLISSEISARSIAPAGSLESCIVVSFTSTNHLDEHVGFFTSWKRIYSEITSSISTFLGISSLQLFKTVLQDDVDVRGEFDNMYDFLPKEIQAGITKSNNIPYSTPEVMKIRKWFDAVLQMYLRRVPHTTICLVM